MTRIIDADEEQAHWEEFLRHFHRPCRDIIVAQEVPFMDAEVEVEVLE